jgi:PAS domain S-box-containing protein
MLEQSPDAFFGIDLHGNILTMNKAAETLYGYSFSELNGKPFSHLLPPAREKEFENTKNHLSHGEASMPFESERKSKSGSIVKISVAYSLYLDDEGRQIGILASERKMTPLKAMENQAQALLETAPDAMVIVNSAGKIILTNAQTEKLFGYQKQELLGKEVEILIPGRFLGKHEAHRQAFFLDAKTRNMGAGLELYGKNKNGIEFPVEISLSPLQTEDGLLVSAAIRDISERKKADEKFRNLLEAAPDAMVIVNESGTIQLVNAQTEKLFGYSRDEIIGKQMELLMPVRYESVHKKHRSGYFHNAQMRQIGERVDLLGKDKFGNEFPVEISLSPLDTSEGLLVSAAIRDISEKKNLEKIIREVNTTLEKKVHQRTAELEIKNKELEQFAYVASHDLQEPLRTASSFVALLKKQYHGKLDATADTYLNFIVESSERMSNLIRELLDYSRIGRSQEISDVDCGFIVGQVIVDLKKRIDDTEATILVENLPILRAYSTELKLLFQNLVVNAIKFHQPGIPPEIHISAKRIPAAWEFSVRDNGIGIEGKHKDRIFVIFQRLHNRTEYEGAGIGLSHCKKIAELHGGHIWVESTFGKGSIFHFTIQDQ